MGQLGLGPGVQEARRLLEMFQKETQNDQNETLSYCKVTQNDHKELQTTNRKRLKTPIDIK